MFPETAAWRLELAWPIVGFWIELRLARFSWASFCSLFRGESSLGELSIVDGEFCWEPLAAAGSCLVSVARLGSGGGGWAMMAGWEAWWLRVEKEKFGIWVRI
jgi:hypothetical protein